MTTVLKQFLVDHKLIVVEPFQEDGSLKEDLILRSSDLTDLGNEFFKEVFPKWSAYIDRGGDIQKTTMLLKGLNKLTQFSGSGNEIDSYHAGSGKAKTQT